MNAPRVSPETLIARLESARVAGPTGLAFDADGTLWSGDVGEDVFEWACGHELLLPDATDALAELAAAYSLTIPARPSPSWIASALYAAYHRGEVPQSQACEFMTWCYAGFTELELRELARKAFAARGLAGRGRPGLAPVLRWAQAQGLRVVVVSASPIPIVDEGLRTLGIEVAGLAGARAALADGRIAPAMAGLLPYAGQKPVEGRRLLAGHDWLGSFGDNGFDVEMLRAARVAVAVSPKPALVSRLGELPNVVVLD